MHAWRTFYPDRVYSIIRGSAQKFDPLNLYKQQFFCHSSPPFFSLYGLDLGSKRSNNLYVNSVDWERHLAYKSFACYHTLLFFRSPTFEPPSSPSLSFSRHLNRNGFPSSRPTRYALFYTKLTRRCSLLCCRLLGPSRGESDARPVFSTVKLTGIPQASSRFPENTLASFEAAMRDGAEGIESGNSFHIDNVLSGCFGS